MNWHVLPKRDVFEQKYIAVLVDSRCMIHVFFGNYMIYGYFCQKQIATRIYCKKWAPLAHRCSTGTLHHTYYPSCSMPFESLHIGISMFMSLVLFRPYGINSKQAITSSIAIQLVFYTMYVLFLFMYVVCKFV